MVLEQVQFSHYFNQIIQPLRLMSFPLSLASFSDSPEELANFGEPDPGRLEDRWSLMIFWLELELDVVGWCWMWLLGWFLLFLCGCVLSWWGAEGVETEPSQSDCSWSVTCSWILGSDFTVERHICRERGLDNLINPLVYLVDSMESI